MKTIRRVLEVTIAVMLALHLTACSFLPPKRLTTPTGMVLSSELSEVTEFLNCIRGVYITIGVMVDLEKGRSISEEQYEKIRLAANSFRLNLERSAPIMLRWYDVETSGIVINREQITNEVFADLLGHLQSVIITVAENGLPEKQRAVIDASFNTLTTLRNLGE